MGAGSRGRGTRGRGTRGRGGAAPGRPFPDRTRGGQQGDTEQPAGSSAQAGTRAVAGWRSRPNCEFTPLQPRGAGHLRSPAGSAKPTLARRRFPRFVNWGQARRQADVCACTARKGAPPTPTPHSPATARVWRWDHCPLWPLVRSKCGWDVACGPTTPTLNFRALGSSQSSSFLEATKTF